MPVFNASIRLAYWMAFVLALQFLPVPLLLVAGTFVGIAGRELTRRGWRRLVRRSRWLLGILVLSLIFVTPGEAVLPGYAPTWEGLEAGGHQLIRLIVMLGAVAWLLALTPPAELVGGLMGWIPGHFDSITRWGTRGALRLALVLRIVSVPTSRGWRIWMDDSGNDDALLADPVCVCLPRWSRADRLALAGLAAGTAGWGAMLWSNGLCVGP